MVRTRPVSWTSAPAVEPEMRLSRMEATSDAAVTHLARVSDGAHSHSGPSSDSPGLAVAYERARAGRCEGEGGSSSVGRSLARSLSTTRPRARAGPGQAYSGSLGGEGSEAQRAVHGSSGAGQARLEQEDRLPPRSRAATLAAPNRIANYQMLASLNLAFVFPVITMLLSPDSSLYAPHPSPATLCSTTASVDALGFFQYGSHRLGTPSRPARSSLISIHRTTSRHRRALCDPKSAVRFSSAPGLRLEKAKLGPT